MRRWQASCLILPVLAAVTAGCGTAGKPADVSERGKKPVEVAVEDGQPTRISMTVPKDPCGGTPLRFAPDLAERLRQLPRTPIDYDRSLLDERETKVLMKLIEASRTLDEIFLRQVSRENPRWRTELENAARLGQPGAADALAYFRINAGPWDRLKRNEPFLGKEQKPPGAGFYPSDMTKPEFERWLAAHPSDKAPFESLFTVIRRKDAGLTAIPYSRQFREWLAPAAQALREAAAATGDASLRDYLTKRADASLSDDYFASDIAWMDLRSDIEVVIGPYEVYEDDLFNQTLFHELSHGLGPGIITGRDGKRVEARLLLKNLYSTIEECKADVVGVWNILYAIDQKWLTSFDPATLFATDAGLLFRSMRFGIDEAHGRGSAVQWNWYREKGAIMPVGDRFRVEAPRFREAARSLAHELLEIEATGDFERARRLLESYGKATPEIESTIRRLQDIPVDITPVFVAAGE